MSKTQNISTSCLLPRVQRSSALSGSVTKFEQLYIACNSKPRVSRGYGRYCVPSCQQTVHLHLQKCPLTAHSATMTALTIPCNRWPPLTRATYECLCSMSQSFPCDYYLDVVPFVRFPILSCRSAFVCMRWLLTVDVL
jgi:hypothetical protein